MGTERASVTPERRSRVRAPRPGRRTRRAAQKLVAEAGGRVRGRTLADGLGLTLVEGDQLLGALADRFECRVNVGADGRLEYAFRTPLLRRPGRRWIHDLRDLFVDALRDVHRLGLGLVIAVYGGVLLLALLGAAGARDPSLMHRIGRGIRNPREGWADLKELARRIQRAAIGGRDQMDWPGHRLERVRAFLARNGGALTAADVITLTGLPYDEADTWLTWLLVHDGADVRVTDDGILLYVLGPRSTRGHVIDRPVARAWHDEQARWEGMRPWTRDGTVLAFTLLTFVGALLLEIGAATKGLPSGLIRVLIADVPLVVAFVSLTAPFLRWVHGLARRDRDLLRALRANIARVLHDHGRPFDVEADLDEMVHLYPGFDRRRATQLLGAASRDLLCEPRVGEGGRHFLDSARLRAEWRVSVLARDHLRAGADAPGTPVLGDDRPLPL